MASERLITFFFKNAFIHFSWPWQRLKVDFKKKKIWHLRLRIRCQVPEIDKSQRLNSFWRTGLHEYMIYEWVSGTGARYRCRGRDPDTLPPESQRLNSFWRTGLYSMNGFQGQVQGARCERGRDPDLTEIRVSIDKKWVKCRLNIFTLIPFLCHLWLGL